MNLAVRPKALRGERARRVETELLDLAALEARPACWDRPAAEAPYPNPLHSRPVLAAHRACGLLDARLRFLAASADGGLRAISHSSETALGRARGEAMPCGCRPYSP
jgi:hypothetical protein